MNENSFDDIFRGFLSSADEGKLRSLYEFIPAFNGVQQAIYLKLLHIALKWNCEALLGTLEEYRRLQESSKKLPLTFTNMLKAVSLYEHFKGYRITQSD